MFSAPFPNPGNERLNSRRSISCAASKAHIKEHTCEHATVIFLTTYLLSFFFLTIFSLSNNETIACSKFPALPRLGQLQEHHGRGPAERRDTAAAAVPEPKLVQQDHGRGTAERRDTAAAAGPEPELVQQDHGRRPAERRDTAAAAMPEPELLQQYHGRGTAERRDTAAAAAPKFISLQ
jgi:hypothetical protein